MGRKAHIISHTHWDREWYINSKFVNEWLPPFFDGLFEMMEKEPSYRFVLDGQTSILDDCYVELEKLGRDVDTFKERVSYYAKRGQLILGPYYLQPDWQLASGESLIRNMLIGRKMSQELGGSTNTGWLLDNFGQISQAPQLHRQFGMKGIVVWRGVELDPNKLTSEFEWIGADGTSMTCSYLLSSYRNAMHLADYPEILYDRIRNETEKIASFSTRGNVLLMNGYDQEMQPDNILPYLRDGKADFDDFTVCQSTPDEFMEDLLRSRGELPQLRGALYSGRYISVFPGILSSRIYLKLRNDEAQRELEQYAEPLNAMCAMLGQGYPHEKLEKAWKLLLKNHPHDSICGVSVDDVHCDMEQRFEESIKLSRECTADAAAMLASLTDTESAKGAEDVFTVMNTLAMDRTVSVFLPCMNPKNVCVKNSKGEICPSQACGNGLTAQIKIPAFGMEVVGIFTQPAMEPAAAQNAEALEAENEYLHVLCNPDGTFDVTDKCSGRVYRAIGALEDSADSGDEYNYSFLTGDEPITTAGVPAEISILEQGPVRTVFRICRTWCLPESLEKNRKYRSDIFREIPVETTVTLTQGDPVLRFHTALRNTCRDHRIRVLFPTDMETEYSFAQTQFDVTPHPIYSQPFDNASIPENVKRIVIGARESLPITQFPQKDFCALSDGKVTAAVVNMGLPEYEVLPEKRTIALTLFRSLGWLTRFDLNTRIGDAGPEMLTPGAQCLRDMEFTYGFCSVAGESESKAMDNVAQSFCTPALAVRTDIHVGKTLPPIAAMESDGAVHMTAVKCAENSSDLILRLYNASSVDTTARLKLSGAEAVSLATPYEQPLSRLSVRDGVTELTLKPREIVTVRVVPAKGKGIEKAVYKTAQVWHGEPHGYDFSRWEIPACVTEAEVLSENARAEAVESRYAAQKAEADALAYLLDKEDATPHERTQAYTAIMRAHSFHRAALEARLSAAFAEEALKRLELGDGNPEFRAYQETLVPLLRKLAYELNLARIDKRVSEYIADYYTHQEKLKSMNR